MRWARVRWRGRERREMGWVMERPADCRGGGGVASDARAGSGEDTDLVKRASDVLRCWTHCTAPPRLWHQTMPTRPPLQSRPSLHTTQTRSPLLDFVLSIDCRSLGRKSWSTPSNRSPHDDPSRWRSRSMRPKMSWHQMLYHFRI